jgi:hypothetical protein
VDGEGGKVNDLVVLSGTQHSSDFFFLVTTILAFNIPIFLKGAIIFSSIIPVCFPFASVSQTIQYAEHYIVYHGWELG